MNASELTEKIKTGFGSAWKESKADGFQSGGPDEKVTGIAVAWTPTLEVMEKAVAEKKNFLLTKEGPYWEDSAVRPERSVSGASPTEIIEKTELYRYKREYIEKNGLVIWRFSQNWSNPKNDFVLQGMTSALGWERYRQSAGGDSLGRIGAAAYTLPAISLVSLVQTVKQRLHAPAARALGERDVIIRNVVVQPGFLSKPDIMSIAGDMKPDAIVCGEGCEWEAFEYAEDWITAGWGKAMVLTGLAVSQDAGARRIAAWLQTLNLGISASYFATGSPFTTVTGDHP